MQSFHSVLKHRAVFLGEDVVSNLDDVVRCNADHQCVEGGVMELAEGDAVADLGNAFRLGVGNDVCCIEQFVMLEPAERALFAIGCQDTFAERLLV
jgi:hypothetical protein